MTDEPIVEPEAEAEAPYVDPEQTSMFEPDELTTWAGEWDGMPEFKQEDQESTKKLIVHFETLKDLADFAKLVGQRITPITQSIWFPEAEIGRFADKRYAAVEPAAPPSTEAEPESSLPPQ